ncbi:hypothetical protein EVAR_14023_1 [Eumeta japonica]|uniref:Uncharacterized protein n=1 Tax=Eumeta variegata TaxID=151549 RepID=A0A4C1X8X8_EUMVA|nr:hypothetical protein EVAR_14023_1 [Eumeta japonica]
MEKSYQTTSMQLCSVKNTADKTYYLAITKVYRMEVEKRSPPPHSLALSRAPRLAHTGICHPGINLYAKRRAHIAILSVYEDRVDARSRLRTSPFDLRPKIRRRRRSARSLPFSADHERARPTHAVRVGP